MNQEVEWRQLNAGLRLILEETLADAILQLPDRERALLSSLYYENKSIQQISSDSGISVSEIINIEKSALIRIWKPLSGILPDLRERVGAVQTSKHQRGVR
jgi:DNA-directed RNA polymerase specialized sigma subunit